MLDSLGAVAVDVAQAAADHVRRRRPELFGRTTDGSGATAEPDAVATKSTPTDPVTLADTETEELIRARLHALRPGDEILGEEEGGSVVVPSGVRWVVDPIDGTVNFMYGIPAYAVSVAAQVQGRSVAGAVVDVSRGVTYSAISGGGAFAETDGARTRLRCNRIGRLDLALVATGFGYDADRRRAQGAMAAEILPRVRDLRRIGAAALDLCMVASGAVDAHFEHGLSPWDWAAGALIAEEAGAVVLTPPPSSRSADGHVTIAVAPGVADEFVALLDEVDARTPLGAAAH
ncbi:inositol monophosphatase family protein [Gordonia sinesedis]